MAGLCLCVLGVPTSTRAQQPFYTDNSDVAAFHRWHVESNNEFDVLPRVNFPNLRQDTQTVKFSVGALQNCEIGLDFPLIAIFNASNSRLGTPIGIGDTDFSIKYNFHKEHGGSNLPAFAVSLNIEPPTGNSRKQLGSGLTDYYLNSIFQKTLSPKYTLRINGGATFAGNTLTGAVGIKARGTIITGGASLVRQFTKKIGSGSRDLRRLHRERKVGPRRIATAIGRKLFDPQESEH